MPYKIRRKTKRPTRKIGKKPVRKMVASAKHQSLVKLIKSVSLKNAETKYTHFTGENVNMNHNGGNIQTSLLSTLQGIADTGTGSSFNQCRLGDEVIARGISLKFWISNKSDRPNLTYRLIVFKYQSQSIPSSASLYKGAIGNRIMDDIDKEFITPVYQTIFKIRMGFSATPSNLVNGDQDGKEASVYKQIWIPLKNKRIHYADGGSLPKFINYGYHLVPYDSWGTLSSDSVASYAYQIKFYFKDP